MEVILTKEISHLGNEGEIVEVKNGYARNYLFPNHLAVRKSRESLKRFEAQKKNIEKIIQEREEKYQAIIQKISEITQVTISVKTGLSDKIFGSITPAHIQELLKQKFDIEVEKKQILLKETIKALGTYTAYIVLNKNSKTQFQFALVSENAPELKKNKSSEAARKKDDSLKSATKVAE